MKFPIAKLSIKIHFKKHLLVDSEFYASVNRKFMQPFFIRIKILVFFASESGQFVSIKINHFGKKWHYFWKITKCVPGQKVLRASLPFSTLWFSRFFRQKIEIAVFRFFWITDFTGSYIFYSFKILRRGCNNNFG